MEFDMSIDDLENGVGEPSQAEEVVVDDNTEVIVDENNPPIEEENLLFPTLAELSGEAVTDDEDDDDNIDDKKPDPNDKDVVSSSQSDVFTSLAADLSKAGILAFDDETSSADITDQDKLQAAIAKHIKDSRYADLNEDQRAYLESVENGVPTTEYQEQASVISQYKGLTDETIRGSEQAQLILQQNMFISKGFTAEKALSLAQGLVASPTSAEDSIAARDALVAHHEGILNGKVEAAKQEKLKSTQDAEKLIAELKSKVDTSSDLIPGVKVNSRTKTKINDSMLNIKSMNGGLPLNEVMEKYSTDNDYKIKIHALHVLTKGFTDFSKLSSVKKNESARSLTEVIKDGQRTKMKAPVIDADNEFVTSNDDMLKHLNAANI